MILVDLKYFGKEKDEGSVFYFVFLCFYMFSIVLCFNLRSFFFIIGML